MDTKIKYNSVNDKENLSSEPRLLDKEKVSKCLKEIKLHFIQKFLHIILQTERYGICNGWITKQHLRTSLRLESRVFCVS
jgi:hypothetical protein